MQSIRLQVPPYPAGFDLGVGPLFAQGLDFEFLPWAASSSPYGSASRRPAVQAEAEESSELVEHCANTAVASSVTIQANTTSVVTFHLTAATLRAAPTPPTARVLVWVTQKLSQHSNRIARKWIRRFESYIRSQPVQSQWAMSSPGETNWAVEMCSHLTSDSNSLPVCDLRHSIPAPLVD